MPESVAYAPGLVSARHVAAVLLSPRRWLRRLGLAACAMVLTVSGIWTAVTPSLLLGILKVLAVGVPAALIGMLVTEWWMTARESRRARHRYDDLERTVRLAVESFHQREMGSREASLQQQLELANQVLMWALKDLSRREGAEKLEHLLTRLWRDLGELHNAGE